MAPKSFYHGFAPNSFYHGLGIGPHGLSPLVFLLLLAAVVAAAGIVIRWRAALARR